MEDKCVSCGAVIPEGRQVCPQCEKGSVKKANEKRLIDANALKWKLGQVALYAQGLRFGKTVISKILESYRRAVFEEIDNAPTEDTEIVKHGRWIIQYIKNSKYRYAFCSECETMGSPQWKRCPVCEAKMDGGNEDG